MAICCGDKSNNLLVLIARCDSITAVEAKAQQLPHPPCDFTAETTPSYPIDILG